MNIEFNPKILQMVDEEMILCALTHFSTGVHSFSLFVFTAFDKQIYGFSSISVKCVPFACIHKNDTLFCDKTGKLFVFFVWEDWHCSSLHIGLSRGHGKKVQNFLKKTT